MNENLHGYKMFLFSVDFVLVANSKHVTVFHGVAVIRTSKISYHLTNSSDNRRKIESLFMDEMECSHQK